MTVCPNCGYALYQNPTVPPAAPQPAAPVTPPAAPPVAPAAAPAAAPVQPQVNPAAASPAPVAKKMDIMAVIRDGLLVGGFFFFFMFSLTAYVGIAAKVFLAFASLSFLGVAVLKLIKTLKR